MFAVLEITDMLSFAILWPIPLQVVFLILLSTAGSLRIILLLTSLQVLLL